MFREFFQSILSNLLSRVSSSNPDPQPKPMVEISNQAGVTYAAGRETTDTPYTRFYNQTRLRAKDQLNQQWKLDWLNEQTVAFKTTTELLSILSESSPDFSRALHDFMQFVVTDYDIVVDTPEGQRVVDDALQLMKDKKESFTVKLEKAAASIFLYGAIFSEVVLDLQGFDFSDFVIIDATLAEFEPSNDPVDGEVYRLGQVKNGDFIDLQDESTVDYIAFDSIPGSPFGRSLSASSIFPIVFSLMILKDLRQVVRTQGYPYRQATIDREKLFDAGIESKKEQNEIIETESEKIIDFISQPAGPYTDVPITGSEVEIKTIEGLKGTGMAGIDTLIQIIERMIVRSLKTYSVIFGINSSSGLSDNSNIQAELHYRLIDSIQKKVEDWIEGAFGQILQASGTRGNVSFKLKRINTLVNRQRVEIKVQESMAIQTYFMNGWIDQQQALDLIRHPDPLGQLATILPPDLSPDAQSRPNEIIEVDEEEGESNE